MQDGADPTRCYCGGWCRWCWSLRETRPHDFPRCFHHLLEKHTEGRVHREWTETVKTPTKSAPESGANCHWVFWPQYDTLHSHKYMYCCLCAKKRWPGKWKKRRRQRSDGLLFCWFDGLFSPFFVLLPVSGFPPFSLRYEFITCVPLSILPCSFLTCVWIVLVFLCLGLVVVSSCAPYLFRPLHLQICKFVSVLFPFSTSLPFWFLFILFP